MQHPRMTLILTAAVAAVGLAVGSAPNAAASPWPDAHGAVFVQTDDLAHNSVIAYDRGADGRLTRAGTYATGGAGAAEAGAVVDPLASQGSLTLDRAHDLLFRRERWQRHGHRLRSGRQSAGAPTDPSQPG